MEEAGISGISYPQYLAAEPSVDRTRPESQFLGSAC